MSYLDFKIIFCCIPRRLFFNFYIVHDHGFTRLSRLTYLLYDFLCFFIESNWSDNKCLWWDVLVAASITCSYVCGKALWERTLQIYYYAVFSISFRVYSFGACSISKSSSLSLLALDFSADKTKWYSKEIYDCIKSWKISF